MSNLRKIYLHDGEGNPIHSLNGALDIHDADVHNVIVNEFFHYHTGTTTTLATDSAAGDTSLDVVDTSAFSVGDKVQVQNGVIETTHPTITAINGTLHILTLDRPLDNAFSAGDTVEKVITDLSTTAGTLSAPISYKVVPDTNQVWHVQSFIISMTHSTAGDDSRLGNIAGGVTNGVVLRGYNATTGTFKTLTNWKQNKDIRLDAFGLEYSDKAAPGAYGTAADGALKSRTGAVARVDGSAGDYIEILVQDDLTTLASFEVKAQGHIEGL